MNEFLMERSYRAETCKSLHLNRSVQRKMNGYQQQNLLDKQRPIYLPHAGLDALLSHLIG